MYGWGSTLRLEWKSTKWIDVNQWINWVRCLTSNFMTPWHRNVVDHGGRYLQELGNKSVNASKATVLLRLVQICVCSLHLWVCCATNFTLVVKLQKWVATETSRNRQWCNENNTEETKIVQRTINCLSRYLSETFNLFLFVVYFVWCLVHLCPDSVQNTDWSDLFSNTAQNSKVSQNRTQTILSRGNSRDLKLNVFKLFQYFNVLLMWNGNCQ